MVDGTIIPEKTLEEQYDLDEDQIEKLGMTEEQQQERLDDAEMGSEYPDFPMPKEESNVFSLFKRVLKLKDNSKVANLDKQELGMLNYTVRDSQMINVLATKLGYPLVGEFFGQQAEVVLKTSASKKGWFTELFVSQKKFQARETKEMPLTMEEQQPMVRFGGGRRRWRFGM